MQPFAEQKNADRGNRRATWPRAWPQEWKASVRKTYAPTLPKVFRSMSAYCLKDQWVRTAPFSKSSLEGQR